MSTVVDPKQEHQGGRAGMTRRNFVKGAAVAAVAVPAVAATQSARMEPVADGKERADLEKYRALGG